MNIKTKKKQKVNKIKIFVINLDKDKKRWKKYERNKRYKRFSATLGSKLSKNNKYLKKIIMMWNVSDKQKRNVVGCLLSHLRVMKHIIKERLNNVLVIEDDALVDFKKLDKLNLNKIPKDKMIYFGGIIRSLTLNDKSWSYENIIKDLKNGINKIDTNKYKIGATHGYFFPKWQVAKKIYNYINNKKRIRAIDGEFAIIQKKNPELLDSFIYPAISYLKLDEALDGFSSQYGIPRDMKYY